MEAASLSSGLARALREPGSRAFLEESSSWAMLATLVVVQVVISGLPGMIGAFMGTDLGPSPGVWLLLAAQLPALLLFRIAVVSRRETLFVFSLVVLTLAQGLWVQVLLLDTLHGFPVLGAVLLVGLSAAWAFNDAQCVYDDIVVRLSHAAPVLLLDLGLLSLDALGGRGLVALYQADPVAAQTLLLTQVLALGLSQMILGSAGALNRRHHATITTLVAERRLAEQERAERSLVRRVGALLTGTLSVGRFSHDVAGPVMILETGIDELAAELAGPEHARLHHVVEDLQLASEHLREMVLFMNQCLRGENPAVSIPVADLVADTREHLRELLRGHQVTGALAELEVDFEPCQVTVDGLQATAIANVAANGVLISMRPVSLCGRRIDDHTYRVSIRDYGVHGKEREAALDRIRASLDLRPQERPGSGPSPTYSGNGLGLVLARMICVRNGGDLSVHVPELGPGVRLDLDLRISQTVGDEEVSAVREAVALKGKEPAQA